MSSRSVAGRRALKRYEGANVVFFVVFIGALGLFVAFVFNHYKNRNLPPPEEPVILSEAIVPGSESCVWNLGMKISQSAHICRGRMQIPITDDGFITSLFEIPEVLEVVVDQKMVMLRKSEAGNWDAIRPAAREIIERHLHLHP